MRHRQYLRILGTLVLLLSAKMACAAYNTNLIGTVVVVATYASGGLLFALTNQPATNGTCNAQFFELDPPGYPGSDAANDAAFSRM